MRLRTGALTALLLARFANAQTMSIEEFYYKNALRILPSIDTSAFPK